MEVKITDQHISIFYICVSAIFICFNFAGIVPSTTTQLYLFLIGALIIGLPHGALDYDVATYLGWCNSLAKKTLFLTIYSLIALIFFALWIGYPEIIFSLFLVVSVRHFGEDWDMKPLSYLRQCIFGMAFLSLPTLYHQAAVTELFNFFVPQAFGYQLTNLLHIIAIPILAIALIFLVTDLWSKKIIYALRVVAFIMGATFLPPLLFLFLYFCTFHSVKHTQDLYLRLKYKSFKIMAKKQILIMLLTLIFVSGIFLYQKKSFDISASLFSAIIILIACVTTPHMLLIDYFNYKEKRLLKHFS